MKKEIYFLFMTPPLVTYLERYCIDYFDRSGWITHIVDLSPFINPTAYKEVTTGLVPREKREILFSKKEYQNYVKNTINGAIFLLSCDFNYDTYFINMCVKKNQYYGYMSRKETDIELASSQRKRLKNFWENLSMHRIASAIFNRLPRKVLPIRAADFIVLGGYENRELYIRLCLSDKHTVIKHFHSWDYEKYLEVKGNKERIVKEPYCVFLDQFIPFHPDRVQSSFRYDARTYYKQLESFFEKMEKKFLVKVVIASHPRADYTQHPDIFSQFEIFRFKTAELVRDAEFVLAHYSKSICFAVMFKKPLLLLTSNEFDSISQTYCAIQTYSQLTGASIFNLSNEVNENEIQRPVADLKKYEEYIRRYLKADYSITNEQDVSCAKQLLDLLENIVGR